MNIWKNFYIWTMPNYNMCENSLVDDNIIQHEFKTIENISYNKISKYLSRYEIQFFDKLSIDNGFDSNYEIGFILYDLYKFLQHNDYFETFLIITFKQRKSNNNIFSIVKRVLDSRVNVPLFGTNNGFIELQQLPKQEQQIEQKQETYFYYVSDYVKQQQLNIQNNYNLYGLCILGNVLNKQLIISNRNIISLCLVRTNLQTIPDEIYNLKNLEILNLQSNQINEIKPQIKNLSKLQEVYFMQNNLTFLPEEFTKLTKIIICDLGHNQLEELPENFGNLINMWWLNLFKNQLKTLPDSFKNLQKLEQLALFRNHFTIFPIQLTELKNLKRLSFFNNQISYVTKNIINMTSLSRLSLASNYLSFFPDISEMKNLKHLHLQNNLFISDYVINKNNNTYIEIGVTICRQSDTKKSISLTKKIKSNSATYTRSQSASITKQQTRFST